MKLIKRDGSQVDFDYRKVESAIRKAFIATSTADQSESVTKSILLELEKSSDKIFKIEYIQDLVETTLMKVGHHQVAKAYILYREKRAELRTILPSPTPDSSSSTPSSSYFDHDLVREFVYLRTYSRWIPDLKRRETWPETVERYISFMIESIPSIPDALVSEIRSAILHQEVMPSMRLLQFAGEPARRCHVCIYNCAFVAPESFKDLADIVYLLMSGTGVGFSVELIHVDKFPIILPSTGKRLKYLIQDSKEGWADALEFGLQHWFIGDDVIFDYSQLRPAGARLKTMGGRIFWTRTIERTIKVLSKYHPVKYR